MCRCCWYAASAVQCHDTLTGLAGSSCLGTKDLVDPWKGKLHAFQCLALVMQINLVEACFAEFVMF